MFFSSDHHFYHNNIIRYCNRPYSSLDHMHYELIKEWNSVVSRDSIIIHLGDFICGGNFEMVKEIVDQLNGYKILITGNHDGRTKTWLKEVGFNQVHKHHLRVKDYLFSHIPLEYPKLCALGDVFNIHGHSHKHQYGHPYFNVGVDLHEYRPISLEINLKEGDLVYGEN